MFSEIKSHEIIYRSVHKLMYGPSIVKQKSHITNQSKQLQTVSAEIRKKNEYKYQERSVSMAQNLPSWSTLF